MPKAHKVILVVLINDRRYALLLKCFQEVYKIIVDKLKTIKYNRGMNDLYLTNGKTGHWRDLGLSKVKKVQSKWPTPQQIKLNATKRETVPVAFRIDEIAYTMLNLFADQCELTTSAFVNELINSYIEQHGCKVEGSVFDSTINLSIDRMASKIKKMRIEQVILNYHQDLLRSAIEISTGEKLPKTDISFCKPETFQKILKANLSKCLQTVFLDCSIDIDLIKKASYLDLREESPEIKNIYCFADHSICMPLEKWIYIQPILMLHDTKCEQFLTSDQYEEICKETNYDEIVKIINKYDGSELVETIAEKLKFKGGAWLKTLQQ